MLKPHKLTLMEPAYALRGIEIHRNENSRLFMYKPTLAEFREGGLNDKI